MSDTEETDQMYERLKRVNEPRGYFFNRDERQTRQLIDGLLANRERYGYMCCPCRLASGDRELDRDIICPCAYRTPDVDQYGSCYCALYVSKEWNDEVIPHASVPERRPPEKFAWA
jgi:ferredoxin-thioredoxin reductase catalytic chain